MGHGWFSSTSRDRRRARRSRRARPGGDRAALEGLLVAVQDDVHRLALRMTGSPDDALGATQEILIRVMARLSTFKGEAAFRTWVHRVAVNHLLDRKRSGAMERFELTFSAFADDLHAGLAPVAPARDRSSICWLARSSTAAHWPCSRASTDRCASCTSSARSSACRPPTGPGSAARPRPRTASACPGPGRRSASSSPSTAGSSPPPALAAIAASGSRRPSASAGSTPTSATNRRRPSSAATAEMEALYDAAQLMRSVNDEAAPEAVAVPYPIAHALQSLHRSLVRRPSDRRSLPQAEPPPEPFLCHSRRPHCLSSLTGAVDPICASSGARVTRRV